MSTLSQVRSALAVRLASITGLNVYETVQATVRTPAVFIRPVEGEFDLSIDGDMVRYEVVLLASQMSSPWDIAQDKVDSYLTRSGSGTIRGAVQADVSLGGTAHSARVIGFKDYGTISFSGVEYFGVKVTVEVWPK